MHAMMDRSAQLGTEHQRGATPITFVPDQLNQHAGKAARELVPGGRSRDSVLARYTQP